VSTVERQRQERARSGSRRKRDREAAGLTDQADRESAKLAEESIAQREREDRLRPQVKQSPTADVAWAFACETLQAAVPASAFRLWLDPLVCVGEVSGALAIEAPEGTFTWTFRRYGALIGRAVRSGEADYRGAFLFRADPPSIGDDEGLL
jgi:hypothetical protein